MQENPIISYYRNGDKGRKLLNQKVHPEVKICDDEAFKGQKVLEVADERFFVKRVTKNQMAAEVFLSRLYANSGLSAATYTPLGKHGFYTHVASNDICNGSGDVVEANVFNRSSFARAVKGIKNIEAKKEIINNVLYLPKRLEDEHVKYDEFITPEAMKKLEIIRAFDISSKNTDRHGSNYFYVVDDNNIITDVICIDFSMSGKNIKYKEGLYFFNDFGSDRLSDYEFLKEYSENENIKQFIAPLEMSEAVGSADVLGAARDVKGDFGFVVPDKMVDEIDRNFDLFACGLSMLGK